MEPADPPNTYCMLEDSPPPLCTRAAMERMPLNFRNYPRTSCMDSPVLPSQHIDSRNGRPPASSPEKLLAEQLATYYPRVVVSPIDISTNGTIEYEGKLLKVNLDACIPTPISRSSTMQDNSEQTGRNSFELQCTTCMSTFETLHLLLVHMEGSSCCELQESMPSENNAASIISVPSSPASASLSPHECGAPADTHRANHISPLQRWGLSRASSPALSLEASSLDASSPERESPRGESRDYSQAERVVSHQETTGQPEKVTVRLDDSYPRPSEIEDSNGNERDNWSRKRRKKRRKARRRRVLPNLDRAMTQCQNCAIRFASREQLAFHLRDTDCGFPCEECGLMLQSASDLVDHSAAIHGISHVFHRYENLQSGMEKTAPTSDSQDPEEVTWEGVVSFPPSPEMNVAASAPDPPAIMSSDIPAQIDALKIPCSRCGAVMTSEEALSIHRLECYASEHDWLCIPERAPAPNSYKCTECMARFSSLQVLAEHLRDSSCGHICIFCERIFPTEGDLSHHLTEVHGIPASVDPVRHSPKKQKARTHRTLPANSMDIAITGPPRIPAFSASTVTGKLEPAHQGRETRSPLFLGPPNPTPEHEIKNLVEVATDTKQGTSLELHSSALTAFVSSKVGSEPAELRTPSRDLNPPCPGTSYAAVAASGIPPEALKATNVQAPLPLLNSHTVAAPAANLVAPTTAPPLASLIAICTTCMISFTTIEDIGKHRAIFAQCVGTAVCCNGCRLEFCAVTDLRAHFRTSDCFPHLHKPKRQKPKLDTSPRRTRQSYRPVRRPLVKCNRCKKGISDDDKAPPTLWGDA